MYTEYILRVQRPQVRETSITLYFVYAAEKGKEIPPEDGWARTYPSENIEVSRERCSGFL